MPFGQGAPKGNRYGARERMFYDTLRRAIAQEDGKRMRKAAEALLDNAAAGEPWAIRELRDTLDGKPAQVILGDAENPVNFVQKVVREIISPENANRLTSLVIDNKTQEITVEPQEDQDADESEDSASI